jgi:hypothetical protein
VMKLCQRNCSVGSSRLCIFTDSWRGRSTDVCAVNVSITGIGFVAISDRNILKDWRSYIVPFDLALSSAGVEAAGLEEC